MFKKLKCLLFIILGFTILSGCTKATMIETEDADTIGANEDVSEAKEISYKSKSISHTFEMNSDQFVVISDYQIPESRFQKWYFTVPSEVKLSIHMKDYNSEKYSIYVNNLYSEVSVNSNYALMAGLRQDSINLNHDSMKESGFSIDNINIYSVPFKVEGINANNTSFYIYNGSGFSTTERVDEDDIRKGANSARLQTVWTLLVKDNETGQQFSQTIDDKLDISIGKDDS